MLYHLYSNADLLGKCRQQVSDALFVTENAKGKSTYTLDILKLKTSYPILYSTYKEVLRFDSTAVSVRLVMEGHILDNQYLLKKSSTMLMPTPVQHYNAHLRGFGNDAFDPLRFTKEKRRSQSGFRALISHVP
jgi:cytochrome P450